MTDTIPEWQAALSEVITDPLELSRLLHLDPNTLQIPSLHFPLRVPRSFVARMQKGNPHDPLLLQILPTGAEKQITSGYTHDPLAEKKANPLPGLLHKYYGRVLWLMGSACAVHCRYCFRQHFPYSDNLPGRTGWKALYQYIQADSSIEEIILSGGDPLFNKDAILADLTHQVATIPHVKTLRIHTRLPIVIPERITQACIDWMTSTRLTPVIVIHSNHPQELDATVLDALRSLRNASIPVFNQAVLLKGINDQSEVLIQLIKQLFLVGVLPYYLHLLDKVQGTAHFEVSLEKAKTLMTEISSQLPGYLVPKLVEEKPGFSFKYPMFP